MKILEITPFSSGFCGVWARVSKEAEMLSKKGYEVKIFSSNIKRGSGKKETAKKSDKIGEVEIQRFETFGNFGDNSYFWNCEKQAMDFKPDIIITHAYRQYYSTFALRIAKKLKIPCLLITHAPFVDRNLRSRKLNLAVDFYDKFFGRKVLNKYSKVLTITKWEEPFLEKIGLKKEKIIYSPNGIPEEFFKLKIPKREPSNKILFLGRLAPIKNIEVLIKAFKISLEKNKKISLEFVGPVENDYEEKIKSLVKELNLEKQIKFSKPVYDLKEKIKIIDNSDIFVLPSNREAMPQALIEAMAREKIVISSKTHGGMEIVKDKETGYLFDINDEKQLAEKILLALGKNKTNDKIRKNAKKHVEQFSWKILGDKLDKLIREEVK